MLAEQVIKKFPVVNCIVFISELLNLGSIRWQDTQDNGKPTLHCDGVPFIIMGSRILDCRHGPERHKKQKEARRTAAQNEVNIYQTSCIKLHK